MGGLTPFDYFILKSFGDTEANGSLSSKPETVSIFFFFFYCLALYRSLFSLKESSKRLPQLLCHEGGQE